MTPGMQEEGIQAAPDNLNLKSFIGTAKTTIPLTIGLALVCNAVLYYFPNVAGMIFTAFAYGGLTGYVAARRARILNIRNRMPYVVLGLIYGILAVYFSWVAYLLWVTHDLWVIPTSILSAINQIAEGGITMQSAWFPHVQTTDTGFTVFIYWLLEAMAIIGSSVLVTSTMTEY